MSGYRIVPEHHVTPETHGPDGQHIPAVVFNFAIRRVTGELVYRTATRHEAEEMWANL